MVTRREFVRGGAAMATLYGCGLQGPRAQPRAHGIGSPVAGSMDGGAADPGLGQQALPHADLGPTLAARTPSSIMRGGRAELDLDLRVLSGRLPTDAFGHAFMVCPLPWGGGVPFFNGDAMVYRVDFGHGRTGAQLRTRILKTADYRADVASVGTDDAFENNGIVRMSSSLGVRNFANTALVPIGERLLATYDVGRPWEIDPVSLDAITTVGYQSEYRAGVPLPGPFPLLMGSAHPYHDAHTGEFFSVNLGTDLVGSVVGAELGSLLGPITGGGFTQLVRWDGVGDVETFDVVDGGGNPVVIRQSAHQLAVTQDYVILMDAAFVAAEIGLLGAPAVTPQVPETHLYVISRDDLGAPGSSVEARHVVVPREAAHCLADYDNVDGRITLHLGHICAADPSEVLLEGDTEFASGTRVRSDLVGMLVSTTDRNYLGKYVIEGESGLLLESAVASDDPLSWHAALYTHRGAQPAGRQEHIFWLGTGLAEDLLTARVADAYRSYPHRTVDLASLPAGGVGGSLYRLDTKTMEIADGFIFPPGRFALSPQFVPRSGAHGQMDGYVLCTVISDDRDTPGSSGDEYWLFDAANLDAGPVCRLGAPELDMPFTLHTTWLPALSSARPDYRVDVRTDTEDAIANSPALQALFETEVYPHFG